MLESPILKQERWSEVEDNQSMEKGVGSQTNMLKIEEILQGKQVTFLCLYLLLNALILGFSLLNNVEAADYVCNFFFSFFFIFYYFQNS